jgi:8-oxo-dGTP pyrophosphatase MutT (NUDIX family)
LYLVDIDTNIRAMKEELERILAQREKRYINDTSRVSSAVMIPLYQKQGQYYIVFIKRTETVKDHKGQISFPGGGRDANDRTLLHTAVRESREEIGLRSKDIEVIGELDDEITTTSNYIVTPFVAVIPWPYRFRKNEDEVAEIMEAPIAALLEKDKLSEGSEILNGQPIKSYTYNYEGKVIWGATARILKKLLDIIEKINREQKPNIG